MDDSQEISSHQDGTHKHGAHQDDTKIAVDMNQPSTLDVSAGSSEEDDRSDLNFRSKVSLFMSLFLRNLEFRDRAQQVKEKCKLSEGMSKDDLGSMTERFRGRYKQGETLNELLSEAFAAVWEVSRRVIGTRNFDEQVIIGGIALHKGMVAKMRGNEGKALSITFAAYLNAIPGESIHIITASDLLAESYYKRMREVYESLGMSIGLLQSDMDYDARKKAYRANVTCGSNIEFGLDYLRDQDTTVGEPLQHGQAFAIVDQADAVFVNEAKKPFIISSKSDMVTRSGKASIVDDPASHADGDTSVTREDQALPTVTLQEYLRHYERLSGVMGMTTGVEKELKKTYNLSVKVVSINEPTPKPTSSRPSLLARLLSPGADRLLREFEGLAEEVNALSERFEAMSDEELHGITSYFRDRYKRGETLDELLPEAFAAVREAAERSEGMRHFDEQIMGGIALHRGMIAEMKTGEGKTLVAPLAAYLNAITGRGVHVVTVNDYLAKRDSKWMGGIYERLGMSVGCLQNGMRLDRKKPAYAADITYGTNSEFGFDYLRDNMVTQAGQRVQRGHAFAIVDEVDSILIDEARTPLIISGAGTKSASTYKDFARAVRGLTPDVDFEMDEAKHTIAATEEGLRKIERRLGIDDLYSEDLSGQMVNHLQQALRAQYLFHRDQQYMVVGGEVKIVDEFTGRAMEGRRYSEGLHQAIEAKEGVFVKEENQTLATITLQNYFRLYDKLSGMTGTAMTEDSEFREIYKLPVQAIPTHEPMIRDDHNDLIYQSIDAKFAAVAKDIIERHAKGQPVLVGTVSIENSERLSRILDRRGVPHEVLNAKFHEREAQIVAQAGREGAVTIATNMAGRGTDIILGGNPDELALDMMRGKGYLGPDGEWVTQPSEAEWEEACRVARETCEVERERVLEAGGLCVMGTERHESRRIDNQLRGRSGRQGDPGETQFYLSLEDDLMRLFGGERMDRIAAMMGHYDMPADTPIQSKLVSRAIEGAQRKVEEINFAMRKQVLEYDDVMNEQRRVIYEERGKILDGKDLLGHINDVTYDTVRRKVEELCPEGQDPEDWDLVGLRGWVEGLTGRKDMPEFGSDLDRASEEQGRDEGISSEVMDAREGRESGLSEERGDGSDDGPEASIPDPDEDAGSQPTGTGKGDEKPDSSGDAETRGKDGDEDSGESEPVNVASGEGDRSVQDGKKPIATSPDARDEDELRGPSRGPLARLLAWFRGLGSRKKGGQPEDDKRPDVGKRVESVSEESEGTSGDSDKAEDDVDGGSGVSVSGSDEDGRTQSSRTGTDEENRDSNSSSEGDGEERPSGDGTDRHSLSQDASDKSARDDVKASCSHGDVEKSQDARSQDADERVESAAGESESTSKDQDEPAGKEDEISVSGKSSVASKDSAKTIGTTNEDGGVSSSQSVRAVPSDDEGCDLFDIDDLDQIDVIDHVDRFVSGCYSEKSDQLPDGMMQALSAQVMLRVIDTRWMSYLQEMDYLRAGIGLRGFGQRDPLVEYKAEAYAAFTELVNTMYEDFLRTILRIELAPVMQARALESEGDDALRGARYSGPAEVDGDQGSGRMSARLAPKGAGTAQAQTTAPVPSAPSKPVTYRKADSSDPYVNVGRNDPCPCGSGKKFKNCHGKNRGGGTR